MKVSPSYMRADSLDTSHRSDFLHWKHFEEDRCPLCHCEFSRQLPAVFPHELSDICTKELADESLLFYQI